MRKLASLAAIFIGSWSAVAQTATGAGDVLMDKTGGCMEGPVAQFGRYIGDWDIEDEGLQQDGTTWLPGNGARWNFTCVGDGIAIQDFWMPNGPEGGQVPGVGTNLRIYDPANERWEIAWTATQSPGFTHIRAEQNDEGDIVNPGLWKSPGPLPRAPGSLIFAPSRTTRATS